ncbi:MAG: hypothetical protein MI861_11555, partial [Pirellulales bacterium]|nr:hypothetical protein [Pirellulales bacterium]
GQTQDLVVVSPRKLSDALKADGDLADIVQPWALRGSLRWINVNSRELEQWIVPEAARWDRLVSGPQRFGKEELGPAETLLTGTNPHG